MLPALLLSMAVAVSPASSGPVRLTLKNGTVYQLKQPPRMAGNRILFETLDGRPFSILESEVATIRSASVPTVTPKYNPQDSRALGGIVRQERKGKPSEVAPAPAARAKKTARRSNIR